MSKTKWAVDGPDGTALEVGGRKFGTNDDGEKVKLRSVLSVDVADEGVAAAPSSSLMTVPAGRSLKSEARAP